MPPLMTRAAIGFALAALAGCASPSPGEPALSVHAPPATDQCILPSERRMLVAELFFGRDRAGRMAVGDAEWADFLKTAITPNFPDGLTVFDGYGQWRNPETGAIGHSPHVKIVLIAMPRDPGVPQRLNTVIDAYKARFRQQSVGLISRDACAAF